MKRACKQCDDDFRVDILEQEWCRSQGLSLPRRCLACRAERRQLTDADERCPACQSSFLLSAQCQFLANLLSWTGPFDCDNCASEGDETSVSKQLWQLDERLRTPVIDDIAAADGVPSLPEDLFKDLDNVPVVERPPAPPRSDAAGEEASPSVSEGVGPPQPVAQPDGDNVPSPDDLFKSLAGPSRRSG